MTSLLEQHCQPCAGGIPPLSPERVTELLPQISDWKLSDDGHWIQRTFKFKNFADALEFVNQIGAIAETEDHHPDIELGWGKATVKFTTHVAKGLTENDFIMAAKINELSK